MDFSLSSVFSSFLSSGNPSDAVTNAQLQIESAVGHFLTTGQTVADLKTQADGQRNSSNPVVVQKAQALSGQASSLLTAYQSIKTDAQTLLNKILDLKNKINADPTKYADPGSSTFFGWSVMDVLSQNKQAVLQASSDGADMVRRINTYETGVDQLQSDVNDLLNFAQGKGVSAALSSIGSAYTGIATKGVEVLVGGLLIYFLGVPLLTKAAGAFQGGRLRGKK